jgi:hypothetical protein
MITLVVRWDLHLLWDQLFGYHITRIYFNNTIIDKSYGIYFNRRLEEGYAIRIYS